MKGGVQCALIGSMVPNTGSFSWMVPASVISGIDYTVKISYCINPLISDVSDANFTINGGAGSTITLTSPNGGETWTAGTSNIVTWTSDVIGNVKIVLLKSGIQRCLIAASIPNTGSFSWSIPGRILAGTEYTVKIMSYANPLLNDVSDANFTIVTGGGTSIALTAPNSGENWALGTTNVITWTSDIIGNVRIVLLKGGVQVRLIAAGTVNDGSHSWLIPVNVITGTDYKILISSCLNPAISDASDLDFSIIATDNDTPGTAENSTVKSATVADELSSPIFKLYPNPATDRLNIVAGKSMTSITVLNSLGKTVYLANPDSRQLTLNLDEYKSGIYFVRIETEGVITTHKIVVE